MSAQAVLLLGGNLGPVSENLSLAVELLESVAGRVEKISSVYQTEPWGFTADNNFLNQAVVINTHLTPEALLDQLLSIEQRLGRDRSGGQGEEKKTYRSRSMDIDIIFYADRVVDTPRLKIPHPLMHERMFVLEPLLEIIPSWRHAVLGTTVGELYAILKNEK